ncbi:tRNA pseudouridine synthase A [Tirmania nivea]|nr:tRNA pseudouridine synthase A [Tirmania nivea]
MDAEMIGSPMAPTLPSTITPPTTAGTHVSIAVSPPGGSPAVPGHANYAKMEFDSSSNHPANLSLGSPHDNQNGHSGGFVENRKKGSSYDRRGGHQNTKQGRSERKKGKKEMGRTAYSRNLETREPGRLAEPSSKRARLEGDKATETPAGEGAEEVEKEVRRPKRKVAVLVGYSGHGYKGMQLNYPNKTIEGDLFEAFVRAGAISRANSNDPKKSSLVRCARTDKGVHAAGNVISLKLIIEDEDIVEKINSHLPDQIRVWGILRTLSSFNCYQLCDSRVYEYLIPSYVFLPPHPGSYLGKILRKHAVEENDLEGWEERQKEVLGFWDDVQAEVDKILEARGYSRADLEEADEALFDDELTKEIKQRAAAASVKSRESRATAEGTTAVEDENTATIDDASTASRATCFTETTTTMDASPGSKNIPDVLVKCIKSFHLSRKRLFRLPPERLQRIRTVLQSYCGTHNFHNYTIQKSFHDPSAKRHIKTFIAQEPILINDVEYLSLRVHGQSFMMHQIRKMIGLALLVVRCGTDPALIPTTYTDVPLAIPKAPGVGLLLDHPVFDSYNKKCQQFPDRDALEFERYKKEIDEFKEKFVYGRMFEEEERLGLFHAFVSFIDSYKSEAFLYLGSKGVKAVEGLGKGGSKLAEVNIGEEEESEEDVEGMEG